MSPSLPSLPKSWPCRVGARLARVGLVATLWATGATATPRLDMRHVRRDHGSLAARDKDRDTWVRLTLDANLQLASERLLERARAHEGAIVVSDVRTGRILVWATRGGSADLVSTPIAPSASLFKVVTAAALLESGKVSSATRQCYAGGEKRIEEEDLDDDRARDDRCTSLGSALGHSVNLVFARLALKHLTPSALTSEASLLGIGAPLPIDVRVPSSVLSVPDDRLGFARAAAGFWNGRLSPLSALFLMQTIANRGERVELSLVDEPGETRHSQGPALKPGTARTLTRMLEVTTRSGTSAKVFRKDDGTRALSVRVAGKTGTLIGGHPTRMYSWFAGFAPSRNPEIAVSVLLANDVRWWQKANEIARDVIGAYLAAKPE